MLFNGIGGNRRRRIAPLMRCRWAA